MFSIDYYVGCNQCGKAERVRHAHFIHGASLDDYKKMTEFQVVNLIKEWKEDDPIACPFCGSENVELFELELGGKMLYDYDSLVARSRITGEYMLQLNIDKDNFRTQLGVGGSTKLEQLFLIQAFKDLQYVLNSRPDHFYQPLPNGNFFICMTGKTDPHTGIASVNVESFRSGGLSKEEILREVNSVSNQVGVTLY